MNTISKHRFTLIALAVFMGGMAAWLPLFYHNHQKRVGLQTQRKSGPTPMTALLAASGPSLPPKARLDRTLALPENEREARLRRILAEWAESEPGKAMAWIEDNGGDVDQMAEVIPIWANRDPEAPVAWLRRFKTAYDSKPGKDPVVIMKLTGAVLAALADHNPVRAAMFFVEDCGGYMNSAWSLDLAGSARNAEDCQAMLEVLQRRQGKMGGNTIADSILEKWRSFDPAACAAWEAANPFLTKDQSSYSVFREVYQAIQSPDPEAKVTELAERAELGVERQTLLSEVAVSWAERDPRSAIRWLEGIEQGPESFPARIGLAALLVHEEPTMVSNLLRVIPDGRELEGALEQALSLAARKGVTAV